MKTNCEKPQRPEIPEPLFQRVNSYFADLDRNHPKMKITEKPTVCSEKSKRYSEYVEQGLVRVEQFGHVLFGEWVTRYEAEGLIIHDPVEWLKNREKRLIK